MSTVDLWFRNDDLAGGLDDEAAARVRAFLVNIEGDRRLVRAYRDEIRRQRHHLEPRRRAHVDLRARRVLRPQRFRTARSRWPLHASPFHFQDAVIASGVMKTRFGAFTMSKSEEKTRILAGNPFQCAVNGPDVAVSTLYPIVEHGAGWLA